MAITSSFANLATVTRASKKTDAGGWDFTNGGTVGTLTEYASGVAAIHATAGVLLEESSTNEIRNPRGEGAVAGTPGTSPTNWSIATTILEIIGTGIESGWPYTEVRFSGTSTSTHSIFFDTETGIGAGSGQTWTIAAGVKLIAGSLSNVSSAVIGLYEYAAGVYQTQTTGTILSNLTASHLRVFHSATLSGGSTDAVRPGIQIITAGAVDFTLRIYAPQCEQKAYPTSPVFPVVASPAATTRAADDVVVANGAWSNDDGAGTIYARFAFNYDGQSSTFPRVLGYGSDSDNRVDVYRSEAAESVYMVVTDGGTQQASMTTSTAPAAIDKKVAVAFDTNDFALSVSGGTQQTDTSGTVTLGSSAIELGQGAGSSNRSSSLYLRDLRYWPRRLSNAELEALVGN